MGKRKVKDGNSEIKKKKRRKSKNSSLNTNGEDHDLEDKISNSHKLDIPKSGTHGRIDPGQQKPSIMQNLLTEKLKRAQKKRSEKSGIVSTPPMIEETKKHFDQGPNNKGLDNESDRSKKNKSSKKVSTNKKGNITDQAVIAESVTVNSVNNEPGEEEELDPEKAAIREKKREKRKQKKQAKLKLKEENAARAGSSQNAAKEYLNQWKNNKSEWKFLKVRQVWLLQNMYDQKMVDDDSFEILLEYLEGLKGKSREVTALEAEKVIEKSETEEDESSTVTDRARQIIQLLSD